MVAASAVFRVRFQAPAPVYRCQSYPLVLGQPIFPRQIGKGTFLTLQYRDDGEIVHRLRASLPRHSR